ncbi:MAG: PTS fructose transporter subunit IIA [Nitrosomonas sp.]|nr:PTS fructose transporter subunit IIA [Nitrosomonas sp.]
MIGILLITHEDLGESLIRCATHVLGNSQPQLNHINVSIQDEPELVINKAKELIRELDSGKGVLVLSDIYGATPCNIASQLIVSGKVDCISGVNLPMLVRALTYRNEPLSIVVDKALSGGKDGVMLIKMETSNAT